MAENSLPDPPIQLKAIQSFMKVASDIERLEPVVAYWVRLYSTETALSIDKDSPECKTFLGALILWLEKFKQTHKDNEAVTNQTVGQAHMDNFVVNLFNKVDTLDRAGTANKNTVRMFYMAAVMFEAMAVFGPLTEEITKKAKYSKFKAAYIQKCLKTGQTPKPGPIEGSDLEDPSYSQDGLAPGANDSNSAPSGGQTTGNTVEPPPPKMPEPPPGSSSSIKHDPFILTPSSAPSYPSPARPPIPPNTPNQAPLEPNLAPKCPAPQPSPATAKAGGSSINDTKFQAMNGAPLGAEDIIKSQKYCKLVANALQYDDIKTAVLNLEKALRLLKTGKETE